MIQNFFFKKKSKMFKIVQFQQLASINRSSSTLMKISLIKGGQSPDLENFSNKNFFFKNAQNASIRVKNMFSRF